MTHTEALDAIADHSAAAQMRLLCREDNPNLQQRDKYRQLAIRLATPGAMAPVLEQAFNAGKAAVRVATAAIIGQPVLASQAEIDARKAICKPCPELVSGQCRLCGCSYQHKIRLATEECPVGKWASVPY